MKADPPELLYHAEDFPDAYDEANYSGLTGFVMKAGHRLLERPFAPTIAFERCIEVGAGTGDHLDFIRHGFGEYLLTDTSQPMLEAAKQRHGARAGVRFAVRDARLADADAASCDRLIASHVLEHLPEPHAVLRQWARAIKPGGVLSILLPCDPGLMWRFGRTLGPRRKAKRLGYADYDFLMAREHVNAITNLVTFLRYYWPNLEERWWPTGIPFSDINLMYAANIRI
jgi:SAM-dependent methyltransferase